MPDLAKQPEKTNRPNPSAYWQQRLTSWDPVMTPSAIIGMLVVIGIIFLPVGITMLFGANSLYNNKIQYGGTGTSAAFASSCSTSSSTNCDVTFTIDADIDGPLYLYYEITNYYQNNIKYSSSVNWNQMMGQSVDQADLGTKCDPATTVKDSTNNIDLTLSPCGLIASSFFTDIFQFKPSANTANLKIATDDIIGPLDQSLFQQPEGFVKKPSSCTQQGAATCTAAGYPVGCATDNDCTSNGLSVGCGCFADANGQQWVYYYPKNDVTQYLYETYPDNISPLDGVTDPHFMNWMNIAALPTFRKLYGKIDGSFKNGQTLTFTIDSTYDVSNFSGTKSLVLSATGALGVKNPGLGVTYIVSGSIMILFAVIFFVKHETNPRPLGSPKELNWIR